MAVVDVEELAKKQGLKPNLQLFAEERAARFGKNQWDLWNFENLSNIPKFHIILPQNLDLYISKKEK